MMPSKSGNISQSTYDAVATERDLARTAVESALVLLRKLTYCPDHYVANYVLVDDGGIFFIPNEDDKVCFWNRDDRPLVRHYTEQFDELWQRSSPDPELRFMPM